MASAGGTTTVLGGLCTHQGLAASICTLTVVSSWKWFRDHPTDGVVVMLLFIIGWQSTRTV